MSLSVCHRQFEKTHKSNVREIGKKRRTTRIKALTILKKYHIPRSMPRRKLPSILQLIDEFNDVDADADADVNANRDENDENTTGFTPSTGRSANLSQQAEKNPESFNKRQRISRIDHSGQDIGVPYYSTMSPPPFGPFPGTMSMPVNFNMGLFQQQPNLMYIPAQPNFIVSYPYPPAQQAYYTNPNMVLLPGQQLQGQQQYTPNSRKALSLPTLDTSFHNRPNFPQDRFNHKSSSMSNISIDPQRMRNELHYDYEEKAIETDSNYSKSPDSDLRRPQQQHIPRPRNAFILFRQHWHQQVFDQEKEKITTDTSQGTSKLGSFKANSQASRDIGRKWRSLPDSEKKYWLDLAKQEKEAHKKKYPDYKYLPTRKALRNSGSSPTSSSTQEQSPKSN
ncbi:Rox1p [Kluyveromyces lactis]|uniref:KLLA0B11495p n=1 Tax=Kluyveromyces lactis (strain ATCC 8585 / CBS 2359 / DSM 70799 / NBRC 1267 / NRRL Y-1140 / WM37) TaxID=284590 RepID=Q6CVJ8_KLULA|nr:uncharacterized protein KLLA0_B11495g [Kluyveromyces lactis]CAH02434.1 KLLA0B11495p [Kluyveromyces lactis]|eukprot:XP_452041.1 uncharacterized protein KLLA0_B11495g [Kluyveromyces lactis]